MDPLKISSHTASLSKGRSDGRKYLKPFINVFFLNVLSSSTIKSLEWVLIRSNDRILHSLCQVITANQMKHLPNAVVEIVHRSPGAIFRPLSHRHSEADWQDPILLLGYGLFPVLCGGYRCSIQKGSLVRLTPFLSPVLSALPSPGGADLECQTEAHLRITETGYRRVGSTFLIQSAAEFLLSHKR